MEREHEPGGQPPDGADNTVPPDWRIDWRNIDERRRARHRREAAGASRDLAAELLGGA